MPNETTYVTYRSFGAKGNGTDDDMPAIVAAHAYANDHHFPVRADEGDVYLIGGRDLTAVIRTDTDWSGAKFIIDDRDVENKDQSLFLIPAEYESEELDLTTLSRGQKKLDRTFPATCLVSVRDETRRNYIRFGPNQSNGTPVSDTFLVDADGNVQNDIMWDFPTITRATVRRIEETPLTVRGGFFTTIANEMPSKYTYYARDIYVRRSHVTISDVTHRVENEGEHGAPYGGFLRVAGAAYVTLLNCSLTGHKIYITDGVGSKVPMGTYDISLGGSAFVTLRGITQVPDIMDRSRWGLMGSNYCKDITLEDCEMSRFDAHAGVTNAVVRRCRLGWQCVEAIGQGTFLIEDTEVYGRSFVQLRHDYGGYWDGEFIIRNCRWIPAGAHPSFLSGSNPGTHDFGYECTMPWRVTVEGLTVNDSAEEICDVALLNQYADHPLTDAPFPYKTVREMTVENVTLESGKKVLPVRDFSYYPGITITVNGETYHG